MFAQHRDIPAAHQVPAELVARAPLRGVERGAGVPLGRSTHAGLAASVGWGRGGAAAAGAGGRVPGGVGRGGGHGSDGWRGLAGVAGSASGHAVDAPSVCMLRSSIRPVYGPSRRTWPYSRDKEQA